MTHRVLPILAEVHADRRGGEDGPAQLRHEEHVALLDAYVVLRIGELPPEDADAVEVLPANARERHRKHRLQAQVTRRECSMLTR